MSSFLEMLSGYQVNNIAALSALISDRLYPVEAAQDVPLPYGVFTQISNVEDIIHVGKNGWGSMRVQYDFYSNKFHEVHDAARALRSAFEGLSVVIANGAEVCFCLVETEFDDYDSKERIYRRSLDLLFEYNITA